MGQVVFDLDGTLIDSAPEMHAITSALLAERGHPPLTLPETRRFIGNGVGVFVERVRGRFGIAADAQEELVAAFLARYADAHDLTVLYPGALAALEALRGAGHGLALCTNKPTAPCASALGHFGMAGFFSPVICGDTLPERKPDPAPLEAAFAGMAGAGPRAYVGDSEVDAETASRAGIPFVLFTGGYLRGPVEDVPHAARFDHHDDLPAVIAGVLAG